MSLIHEKFNVDSKSLYKVTLKYHIIFWTIYFIFNTLRWGSYFDDYIYSLRSNTLGFPIHITLVYLNLFVLMPKFVYEKKYLTYILLVFVSILIMVFIKFNLTYYLLSTNVWPEGPGETDTFSLNYVVEMFIGELYVVTFVTAIKITMDWLKEHKRLTDLEKLQLETELLFLKTQISPHFFFNTLNNIYSLAIEKSDKTPKIILKLSELMRYLLYETKLKRQSLENEILCIQNYLDLERIRYGELLTINMNISGDIKNKKIAPILLLSFVENSFKHGANKNIGKIRIDIDIEIIEDFLYFSISNPSPAITKFKQRFDTKGGIGLKNVQKRLSLGYKKEEYNLRFDNKKNLFTVKLKIKV